MIKVGIIIPTWHYFDNPFKLQPIHELYYATVVADRFTNVDVEVVDLRDVRRTNSDTLQYVDLLVAECDLFIYWIMKTADCLECYKIVERLKINFPKSKHIAGGTHVTNFAEECSKIFDSVMCGPGEDGIIDTINRIIDNKELIKIYRSSWSNNQLSSYPFPDRSYLPKRAIVNKDLFSKYGSLPGTSVMFSRGCDFKCTYCVYNFPDRAQYSNKIKDEINYLKKFYNISAINLRDEICIPMRSGVSTPFLESIGQSNVVWRGQTRVGIKKDALQLAASTGCKELSIGVESASEEVRRNIKKTATFDEVKNFVEWSHELSIKIKLCLILGLPGEPLDVLEQTIKFIEDVGPDYVAVSGFCPVPGSEIYRNYGYYGIKYIDTDWSKHAHLVYRFEDEEEHGLPFEYEEFNRWGKTMSRNTIINSIKSLQQYLRERNMAY